MDFCSYDIRPVPDDACCRVHNPGRDAIGLHLRQAYKLAGQSIQYAARHVKASWQMLRRVSR